MTSLTLHRLQQTRRDDPSPRIPVLRLNLQKAVVTNLQHSVKHGQILLRQEDVNEFTGLRQDLFLYWSFIQAIISSQKHSIKECCIIFGRLGMSP